MAAKIKKDSKRRRIANNSAAAAYREENQDEDFEQVTSMPHWSELFGKIVYVTVNSPTARSKLARNPSQKHIDTV